MTLAPVYPHASAVSCSAVAGSAFRRLVELCPALEADVAEPGSSTPQGWADGVELAGRPEFLDALLGAEVLRVEHDHGRTPRPDVAASRALHDYLWSVGLLMSGPWCLERRVPRIRPQDVRVSLTTGAFSVVPGGFACLPGDPAAGLPGVRVLPHEEALRAELRAGYADHVRPLLTAIAPRVRRGPRALWGMAGDDLVSGVWYLGRMLGEEERGVRAAAELLPEPVPPFPGGADFRRLAGREGRSYPTRTRAGCCLYYTIRPAEACGTCPRTSDAERLRRLEGEGPC
ncbi:(2Fe-2S)-binding protein [Streptomyces sp. NPDC058434]|uniref:(2Fe-2S)-binding protein n=1 Tax=Streptomyces sp. NPDC058434 TaxID=3346498 RepID=UPI00365D8197